MDFVARLSYQYIELDAPASGGADDSGVGLGAGITLYGNADLELTAGISFVDFGDGGNDTGFSLAASFLCRTRWHLAWAAADG